MKLNLRVMAPNRIVWNSEVEEIILSTNSGKIGILPNHAPLLTALDIGVTQIRLNGQWSNMALMGGFGMIDRNEVIILVNEAEKGSDIDIEEAKRKLLQAKYDLDKAESRKNRIEATLALKRAKARLDATTT
uniref:CF1 subunit epsilon n=1 Tax=Equisetum ramosissimum TaxID=195849 RepID=UPI001FCD72C4|nr:CF1 subunit epsilon [Equisetum ramosissimum]UNI91876.1 CF1 subunit epsilon [Equisetum ramosissimum]UVF34888.1 CF1 subunit epsilon [Equisetum ramosissimum]